MVLFMVCTELPLPYTQAVQVTSTGTSSCESSSECPYKAACLCSLFWKFIPGFHSRNLCLMHATNVLWCDSMYALSLSLSLR